MTTGTAGTLSAADDTDEELLLRTQSGDRDRAEAEDLVQDIFLKLFAAKQGFEPDKGGARTWIVQFIYRRAFDRRAFLTRRHFYAGNNPDNAKSTGDEGPAVNIMDRITSQLAARRLVQAFHQLTEPQRTTVPTSASSWSSPGIRNPVMGASTIPVRPDGAGALQLVLIYWHS